MCYIIVVVQFKDSCMKMSEYNFNDDMISADDNGL